MTYLELSALFGTIASGLGLQYEEGAYDQINTIFRDSDAYPLCYCLPAILNPTANALLGPEGFTWRYWDCQILFIDIDTESTGEISPDIDNPASRGIRSRMIEKAKAFEFNLYEGPVSGFFGYEGGKIEQLSIYQDGNGAFGATFNFQVKTLNPTDCEIIVTPVGIDYDAIGSFFIQ